MPVFEMLIKDIVGFFTTLFYRFYHQGQLPVVVVFPDFPSKKTTIAKICKMHKYRLTNRPIQADLVIYFEDSTHGDTKTIERNYGNRKIINRNCTDISKIKVDRVHQHVFGYNTCIDPLTYTGIALCKSDDNAKHDGEQIECPIPQPDPRKIYQVIIDNTVSADEVVDMRVPVYGDSIPLVYLKYKKMNVRYTNVVHRSTLHATNDLLTAEEQKTILAFAKGMGADWCELDILRNKTNGLIYIVDLNKTPYGPPAELAEKEKAVTLLATAFQDNFVSNTLYSHTSSTK